MQQTQNIWPQTTGCYTGSQHTWLSSQVAGNPKDRREGGRRPDRDRRPTGRGLEGPSGHAGLLPPADRVGRDSPGAHPPEVIPTGRRDSAFVQHLTREKAPCGAQCTLQLQRVADIVLGTLGPPHFTGNIVKHGHSRKPHQT